ncbi:hypothetical protein DPMN_151128 [Dreissena polymorpha]|uniref:Uncharacterized protein n=1 Tax=Dreissena polymorpha TaxID=45954 RepID=A0A9D4FF07_DREPO|nr:hypothetical protein DPMN_151128 [Dreissena polymorpha]
MTTLPQTNRHRLLFLQQLVKPDTKRNAFHVKVSSHLCSLAAFNNDDERIRRVYMEIRVAF